jgi:hypothetical protein
MNNSAKPFFLAVQRAFEELFQVDLDESHDSNGIDHGLNLVERMELARPMLEVAIHRVANAVGCTIQITAAFEQPSEMAQRLKEICDRRLAKIGTRIRAQEMRAFYTDAFLALLAAYIEPHQNEYDSWLAQHRKCPFFDLDLEAIELD